MEEKKFDLFAEKKDKLLIAPSILSADFSKMGDETESLCRAGADLIHCDVMDGVFVPNITFGIKMIKDIKKHSNIPLDVHLMIVEPHKYVKEFAAAGADIITVHCEACGERLKQTCEEIKQTGTKCGVAVNPDTPLSAVENVLSCCDMLLIMSVFPGFGGQKFIEDTYKKLRDARKLIEERGLNIVVQVDGGVNADNCSKIFSAGADIAVAGSAVFNASDRAEAISALKNN